MPKSFFAKHKDEGKLSKEIQTVDAERQVAWESISCVDCSPGAVLDEEILCRQILHPVHVDKETGAVKPTVFDDVSSRGASVHRRGYISDAQMIATMNARVEASHIASPEAPKRSMVGYVPVSVQVVRSIKNPTMDGGGRRQLGVYDTAKEDDPSHADICLLVSGKIESKENRAILFNLVKDKLVKLG